MVTDHGVRRAPPGWVSRKPKVYIAEPLIEIPRTACLGTHLWQLDVSVQLELRCTVHVGNVRSVWLPATSLEFGWFSCVRADQPLTAWPSSRRNILYPVKRSVSWWSGVTGRVFSAGLWLCYLLDCWITTLHSCHQVRLTQLLGGKYRLTGQALFHGLHHPWATQPGCSGENRNALFFKSWNLSSFSSLLCLKEAQISHESLFVLFYSYL